MNMSEQTQDVGAQDSASSCAITVLRAIASRGKRLLFPPRDYVVHKGSRLPAPGLRFNGPDHQGDEFYLRSSMSEAERVVSELGCEGADFLVDIGCGQGRLPIGLVHRFKTLRYLGLDVSAQSIEWCQRHIEGRYPSYRFQHINLVNERYNPEGSALSSGFRLPVPSGAVDIVYMWGVVTNMEPAHLPVYASEIARMLRPGGKLHLTANVEDDVPEVSINPDNYTSFAFDGPLHIVRYERHGFVEVFHKAGLEMMKYLHHTVGNCQSDLYFVKR
jgi:SAM-dependent methyltransferase